MKRRFISTLAALVLLTVLSLSIAAPAFAWFDASTSVNIQGPATPVPAGTTVSLIVTETNDSANPGYWIDQVWVSLEPGGYMLDRSNYTGGDVINPGVLDVGETWQWKVDVTINQDTLFTAIGHGWLFCDMSKDVTYETLDDNGNIAFPNEKFELQVLITPPPPPPPPPPQGDEGFTPGFWKNHYNAWQPTGYKPTDNFNTVFGVTNSKKASLTLGEGVKLGGGGENALIRHAVAALLNSTHPGVDYPLTASQVIAKVQNAFTTGKFEAIKNIFEYNNELGGNI